MKRDQSQLTANNPASIQDYLILLLYLFSKREVGRTGGWCLRGKVYDSECPGIQHHKFADLESDSSHSDSSHICVTPELIQKNLVTVRVGVMLDSECDPVLVS